MTDKKKFPETSEEGAWEDNNLLYWALFFNYIISIRVWTNLHIRWSVYQHLFLTRRILHHCIPKSSSIQIRLGDIFLSAQQRFPQCVITQSSQGRRRERSCAELAVPGLLSVTQAGGFLRCEREAASKLLSSVSTNSPSPDFVCVFHSLTVFCLMIFSQFAHFQGSRFLAWWRTRVIGIWATFGRITVPGRLLEGATTPVGPECFLWLSVCVEVESVSSYRQYARWQLAPLFLTYCKICHLKQ